jgi:hypothetical protein
MTMNFLFDNTGGVMTKRLPFNLDPEGILLWTRNKDSRASGFAGGFQFWQPRQNRGCFENATLKVV